MTIETLEDLFGYQLQRVYYAERSQVELLAELADDAPTAALGDRLADHRDETERHVDRLEGVFAALGRHPQASRSRAADGLAESWHHTTVEGAAVPSALEIALLAERLEIRRYESLLTLAGRLVYADDVAEPLEAILADERETLQALKDLE